MRLRPTAQSVLGIGVLALSLLPARAAEQITLNNGFEISCHHHGTVHRRVRLYLGAGNDSYIEVAPGEIASVEKVLDPPSPPPDPAETPSPGSGFAEGLAPAPASPASAIPAAKDLTKADLNEMLTKAGHEHNVDVDLLASIVKAESGGNAKAVSRAGAQGLMQLMPGTAADLGVSDSFRPDQNVRGGSTYIDELLTRYHDNLALALAAYNAGPAAVDKYHGIPPYRETKLYVACVIHEFNRRVRAREAQDKRAIASASTGN